MADTVYGGYLTKMPSFYVYLIDIERDKCGQRIVTVGVTHWLLGIYAEIEIHYRIYPELFEPPSLLIYLPFVSHPVTDFKIDYVEQSNLTRRDVNDFIVGVIAKIIEFMSINYFDSVDWVVKGINEEHSVWISSRLAQVLCYNQRLVAIVRQFMKDRCVCSSREEEEPQICYCSTWTQCFIDELHTKYFADAKLIVSDEVFFKTPR